MPAGRPAGVLIAGRILWLSGPGVNLKLTPDWQRTGGATCLRPAQPVLDGQISF